MPSNDNPFAALAALRESLPRGEEPTASPQAPAAKKSKLAIHYERKGRGGKEATIISGFADDDEAREAGRELRRRLATGGSARGAEVLLQGDRREAAREALLALGYRL